MKLENICQTSLRSQFLFFQLKVGHCQKWIALLSHNAQKLSKPTTPAIGKIVNKFEETGMVINIKTHVHHRFAENAAEDSNVSIHRRCQEL